MPSVAVKDIGLKEYRAAWDFQELLFNEALATKKFNKDHPNEPRAINNHLIFCEHPHVYTLGKSGSEDNLLLSKADLEAKQIAFFPNNRGGDITYHGPGQIVVYPILDLEQFKTDIHWYMRSLEQAVINCLRAFGISAGRLEGATGVWLDAGILGQERKICALGVKTSRWVSMHGLALNVNTDLSMFENIIPCGINDKAVTSMEKELNGKLDIDEVKQKLKTTFAAVFEVELVNGRN